MIDMLILAAALPLLAGLLVFEKRPASGGRLLAKSALSALFVAAALAGPSADPGYFRSILTGLLLCLAGDVFLVYLDRPRLFLAGLVAFLAGHVCYSIAFLTLAWPARASLIAVAVLVTLSGGVFVWLRPRLGKMLVPVIAYIAVITVMVIGALSLMENEGRDKTGRLLALTGALLFYLSDLFVARQRFASPSYLNRLLGLPLYYAAQFLIAFSTRFL
jgi:uncharacterized membrane protein YhhN